MSWDNKDHDTNLIIIIIIIIMLLIPNETKIELSFLGKVNLYNYNIINATKDNIFGSSYSYIT